jgi:phosphosulfolactate phosphohydrolase-like enzyme
VFIFVNFSFALFTPPSRRLSISGEAKAFEEILNDRGDICAFSNARGVAAILEKAGCEHVKVVAQTEAAFSLNDMKDPSAEASLIGGKFYSDI